MWLLQLPLDPEAQCLDAPGSIPAAPAISWSPPDAVAYPCAVAGLESHGEAGERDEPGSWRQSGIGLSLLTAHSPYLSLIMATDVVTLVRPLQNKNGNNTCFFVKNGH